MSTRETQAVMAAFTARVMACVYFMVWVQAYVTPVFTLAVNLTKLENRFEFPENFFVQKVVSHWLYPKCYFP